MSDKKYSNGKVYKLEHRLAQTSTGSTCQSLAKRKADMLYKYENYPNNRTEPLYFDVFRADKYDIRITLLEHFNCKCQNDLSQAVHKYVYMILTGY